MTVARTRSLIPRLRELVSPRDKLTADRELLRRFAAQRDEDAFAEIVRRHGPMVLRVCRRALRGGADAEDISQAAFLLLATKAGSVGWRDSVAGWLYQTAYRLSRKASVAARRRARHEAQARPAGPADAGVELTARELLATLDEELSRLPEKYRDPIVLCCLEGCSRDEAAGRLGWSLAAVKDRLKLGRARLRAQLARRGIELGATLAAASLVEGAARAALEPRATARAALLIATGEGTLAGLLPAPVAALTNGGATMLTRGITVLFAGLALALGAGLSLKGTAGGAGPPPKMSAVAGTPPAGKAPAPPTPRQRMRITGPVTAVALGPGIQAVAVPDRAVFVYDDFQLLTHQLHQPDLVVGVAFSPDGTQLAALSAGEAGRLVLWGTVTGKELWRGTPNHKGAPSHFAGKRGAVAFSPDGTKVSAGAGGEGVALLALDTRSRERLHASWRHKETVIAAVAYSPDSKLLAIGDRDTVCVNDAASGKELRAWRVKGTVTGLGILPGGSKLAVADGGKAVRLLDMADGTEVEAFRGTEPVRALAVTPDGKWLATAGADGGVVVWDTAGKQERRFSADFAVTSMAFSPDGKALATVGAGRSVIWDLTGDEEPLPKGFKLAANDLPKVWDDLASDDGGKAYSAARLLRADPARAVPFLAEILKPKAAKLGRENLARLLAALDADKFEKRELATKELEKLVGPAEPALREALAARPSPEAKQRLERLLRRPTIHAEVAEEHRDVRAVRLLSQIGSAEAKSLLEAISKAVPGWRAALEAKKAIQPQLPTTVDP